MYLFHSVQLWIAYWLHVGSQQSTSRIHPLLFSQQMSLLESLLLLLRYVISLVQVHATLPTHFWVNLCVTLRWVNDGVISPIYIWVIPPTGIQVILPACFQVNEFAAPLWVNSCTALWWVKIFTTPAWVNNWGISPVHIQVIPPVGIQVISPAHFWVNEFAAPL